MVDGFGPAFRVLAKPDEFPDVGLAIRSIHFLVLLLIRHIYSFTIVFQESKSQSTNHSKHLEPSVKAIRTFIGGL